jgi:uncharacterized protein YukE
MREIRVQPESIASTAPMCDGVAHEVRTAVAKLRATLDGPGDFWGDDEQGACSAEGYRPNATTVQRSASNIAVGLNSIAAALAAQANNRRRTDSAIAERMTVKPQ